MADWALEAVVRIKRKREDTHLSLNFSFYFPLKIHTTSIIQFLGQDAISLSGILRVAVAIKKAGIPSQSNRSRLYFLQVLCYDEKDRKGENHVCE